jgi:hypothetical protein
VIFGPAAKSVRTPTKLATVSRSDHGSWPY